MKRLNGASATVTDPLLDINAHYEHLMRQYSDYADPVGDWIRAFVAAFGSDFYKPDVSGLGRNPINTLPLLLSEVKRVNERKTIRSNKPRPPFKNIAKLALRLKETHGRTASFPKLDQKIIQVAYAFNIVYWLTFRNVDGLRHVEKEYNLDRCASK